MHDARARRAAVQGAGRHEEGQRRASWNAAAALFDPGFVAMFAQVPSSDSLDAARDAMIATLEGVQREPDHGRRRSTGCAHPARSRTSTKRSPIRTRFGDQPVGVDRAPATGGSSSSQRDRFRTLTAGRRAARGARATSSASNRAVARVHSRPETGSRGGARAPSTSPRCSRTTRATPPRPPGEAFDADSRQSRRARRSVSSLANGMKVALLPKKTRGADGEARAAGPSRATRSRCSARRRTGAFAGRDARRAARRQEIAPGDRGHARSAARPGWRSAAPRRGHGRHRRDGARAACRKRCD